jgi:di- and tripeptidase
VDHTADWWLGDLTHPWFLELERAIHDEWGREPMRVREGGVRPHFFFLLSIPHTHPPHSFFISLFITQQSIPCVPFLEKAFRCPALHLPMGQSEVRDEFFFSLVI